MQGLLQLLSSNIDVKLEICKLATGRAQASPFPPELVVAGRELLFSRLREAGSMAELDKVAERQPFYLEAVSELLRLAGDPDWRRYTASTWSFSKGVPLGVDVRLPRTPALFPRKTKHRIYAEADRVFDGELRDNYISARERAEQIERQFEQEVEMGAMVRCDLEQARAEYGDELFIASLGAVPKSDQTVRVVHDATHGLHVNDRIRVRDAQTYPTGADLKVALEQLPGAYFSLSGDIARAHRLVRVRRQDWCRQASAATSMIFLNTVGTFGLASASYWWFRLMSGLGRLLYYSHGRDATTLLSYVDDLIWLTQSPFGLIRILASIFLLEILGMPFAWRKFRGGTEHSWIGFSVFAFERRLGISQSRADWLIGWIRRTRAEGRVRVADLSAVVGRLSFTFTLLPLFRPFLGPLYAWTCAVNHCHVLRLPKAVSVILAFLELLLMKGHRTIAVHREARPSVEFFRTDAKAEGSAMVIAGWACFDASDPRKCRWFSEELTHLEAPHFFMSGEPYRAIASLELLATLVAILLFEPGEGSSGSFSCSAGTDNMGKSHLTSRWLTTSFPLVAALMELAIVLHSRSLDLSLHWLPRLQNTLADSLTNGDSKDFDPKLRLRFSLASYQGLILKEMLEAGSDLYGELAGMGSRKRAAVSKAPKASKLRNTDPWK